jgi:hypothetical protein
MFLPESLQFFCQILEQVKDAVPEEGLGPVVSDRFLNRGMIVFGDYSHRGKSAKYIAARV